VAHPANIARFVAGRHCTATASAGHREAASSSR
jgi:hypothetical protein